MYTCINGATTVFGTAQIESFPAFLKFRFALLVVRLIPLLALRTRIAAGNQHSCEQLA
ncbi:Uncharacterised protein [Yersinia intermedia]|uniref:Uncharacterized protein n=1 Tax=Yersinia intermedia TaxID=631 RepID=A0A0H5LQQ8_YERIN|nr:Uncharacterised protein [Yersinia intermedia]